MYPPLKILLTGRDSLPPVPAPCQPWQYAEWAAARPFVEVSAADDCLREWIATRQWPTLADSVRAQIHLRFEMAIDLLSHPEAQESSRRDSPPDVLRMALIEFWHGKGIEWTRFRYPPKSFGSG